jgi:hypothetical protein
LQAIIILTMPKNKFQKATQQGKKAKTHGTFHGGSGECVGIFENSVVKIENSLEEVTLLLLVTYEIDVYNWTNSSETSETSETSPIIDQSFPPNFTVGPGGRGPGNASSQL